MVIPTFSPVGDAAILANFGNEINPSINGRIRHTLAQLVAREDRGLIEFVPTYCSLLVQYDPLVYTYAEMCELIGALCESNERLDSDGDVTVVEIPTCYGGIYGADIDFVANHAGLMVDEVISIHRGTDHLVYMLGFIPGFTYLGGLDERLTTPRLANVVYACILFFLVVAMYLK